MRGQDDPMIQHEVRLRAAAWARRLVATHGDDAERFVRDTLRRRNLSGQEKLAARYTNDALRDLRRVQGYAAGPRRRRGIAGGFVWLISFGGRWGAARRYAASRLSHQ